MVNYNTFTQKWSLGLFSSVFLCERKREIPVIGSCKLTSKAPKQWTEINFFYLFILTEQAMGGKQVTKSILHKSKKRNKFAINVVEINYYYFELGFTKKQSIKNFSNVVQKFFAEKQYTKNFINEDFSATGCKIIKFKKCEIKKYDYQFINLTKHLTGTVADISFEIQIQITPNYYKNNDYILGFYNYMNTCQNYHYKNFTCQTTQFVNLLNHRITEHFE